MDVSHDFKLHESLACFFSINMRLPTDNASRVSGYIELKATVFCKKETLNEGMEMMKDILEGQHTKLEESGTLTRATELPAEWDLHDDADDSGGQSNSGYSIKKKR